MIATAALSLALLALGLWAWVVCTSPCVRWSLYVSLAPTWRVQRRWNRVEAERQAAAQRQVDRLLTEFRAHRHPLAAAAEKVH